MRSIHLHLLSLLLALSPLTVQSQSNNEPFILERPSNRLLQRDSLPQTKPVAPTILHPTSPDRQRILQKLERIVIPEIFFDGIPLSEAIDELSEKVRTLDPEKHGINFIIKSQIDIPASPAPVDRTGRAEFEDLPPIGPVDLNKVIIRINPPLTDIRLWDVLDAITKVADKPLKFSVEDHAVVITTRSVQPPELFTRTFKVDPDTFFETLQKHLPNGDAATRSEMEMLRELLAQFGLDFPANQTGLDLSGGVALPEHIANGDPPEARKRLFMSERFGIIGVRAPLDELDIIDQVLLVLNGATLQAVPEDSNLESPQLVTRTFKVDPNTFFENLKKHLPNAYVDQSKLGPMREFLALLGVNFATNQVSLLRGRGFGMPIAPSVSTLGPAKVLTFNERTGIFHARATVEEIDIMEKAIRILNWSPPLVNLDVRLVEITEPVSQAVVRALQQKGGANSSTNSPPARHSGTHALLGAGILTDSQFHVVLRALEQRVGVDMLSMPKVATPSGRQAQVQVSQSKSVVLGAASDLGADSQVTKTIAVGPMVEVTPHVSADGQSINMAIAASVTEFLGYDDPGPFRANGGSGPITAVSRRPKFRIRQITSEATVWDGQTLALSGFVPVSPTNSTNKIPMPGDITLPGGFFSTETSSLRNKQLILFVTPTIIDSAGNPVHTGDNRRFDPNTVPDQPQY